MHWYSEPQMQVQSVNKIIKIFIIQINIHPIFILHQLMMTMKQIIVIAIFFSMVSASFLVQLQRRKIKDSKGHGLFAIEAIPKGTHIYNASLPNNQGVPVIGHTDSPNIILTRSQVEQISKTSSKKEMRTLFEHFIYIPTKDIIFHPIGLSLINHSFQNNLKAYDPVTTYPNLYTNRDIQAGEELTLNYVPFQAFTYLHPYHWYSTMVNKYSPTMPYEKDFQRITLAQHLKDQMRD